MHYSFVELKGQENHYCNKYYPTWNEAFLCGYIFVDLKGWNEAFPSGYIFVDLKGLWNHCCNKYFEIEI